MHRGNRVAQTPNRCFANGCFHFEREAGTPPPPFPTAFPPPACIAMSRLVDMCLLFALCSVGAIGHGRVGVASPQPLLWESGVFNRFCTAQRGHAHPCAPPSPPPTPHPLPTELLDSIFHVCEEFVEAWKGVEVRDMGRPRQYKTRRHVQPFSLLQLPTSSFSSSCFPTLPRPERVPHPRLQCLPGAYLLLWPGVR